MKSIEDSLMILTLPISCPCNSGMLGQYCLIHFSGYNFIFFRLFPSQSQVASGLFKKRKENPFRRSCSHLAELSQSFSEKIRKNFCFVVLTNFTEYFYSRYYCFSFRQLIYHQAKKRVFLFTIICTTFVVQIIVNKNTLFFA